MSNISHILDRPIAFQRSFVRLGAGVTGALLLSQAAYWSRRTDSHDGWFYKTQADWEEETGMKRSEQEKARRALVSLGVLEEKKSGIPAKLYFRINEERIISLLTGDLPATTVNEVLSIFKVDLKQISQAGYMRAVKAGVQAEVVDYAEVLKAHGMTCSCCSEPILYGPGKKAHCLAFDHVQPLAKNGSHTFANIRPAHAGCNAAKGARTQEESTIHKPTNKDAYTKQTGVLTPSKPVCLHQANIHTEITTEITTESNPTHNAREEFQQPHPDAENALLENRPPPPPTPTSLIGKFQMFDGWQPSGDFLRRSALWGITLTEGPTPEETAGFVAYWEAEGKFFHQVQWEQKFARSVQEGRRRRNVSQPGLQSVGKPVIDYDNTDWIEGLFP